MLLEPLDALGKGGAQLFDGFERVVEGDDGAIAGIALHVVHHVVGGEPLGVVARNEIPHHHLIALAGEQGVLHWTYPPVGWTEQVAVNIGIGFLHVDIIAETAMKNGNSKFNAILAVVQQ